MCYIFDVYNSHCFLEFCFIVVFCVLFENMYNSNTNHLLLNLAFWCHFIQLCRWSKDCGGCNCKMAILLPRLPQWQLHELPPDALLAGLVRTQRHARCSSPQSQLPGVTGLWGQSKSGPQKKLGLNTFTEAISRQLQSRFILLSSC